MEESRRNHKKIVVAGHICLDITPAFPEKETGSMGEWFLPGKLLQMGGADVHTGGAVANTGLALKLLGADVTLMAKTGKDAFGELVHSLLAEYQVQQCMRVSPSENTSYSVVIAPRGIDRIFLHHSGANDSFVKEDLDFSELEDALLFHFGYPTVMKSMYEAEGKGLVELFQEVKKTGVLTSLDMAAVDEDSPAGQADWETILEKVLPFVDFFVPSVEELAFTADRARYRQWQKRAEGRDITTVLDVEKDIRPLAEKVLSLGPGMVLIKCGALGLYLACTGADRLKGMADVLSGGTDSWAELRRYEKSYRPDRILSGTGAGDTSIAAFLYAVITGHSWAESLQLAAATGASCVAAYDALSGLKRFSELKQRIQKGWEKCGE